MSVMFARPRNDCLLLALLLAICLGLAAPTTRGMPPCTPPSPTPDNGEPSPRRQWQSTGKYNISLYETRATSERVQPDFGDYDPDNPSTPTYAVSETPRWDFHFSLGGGYESSDFTIDTTGSRFKSNTATYTLGVDARKDRFMILNDLRYQRSAGMGQWKDLDTRTLSWTFMPGYAVLMQEEAGVNVNAFFLLGLSHVDADGGEPDCFLTPGLALNASRATNIGIFSAAYTFNHSRSLNGRDQITGASRINLHSGALNYTIPLAKKLFATAGADYVYACQVPSSMANEFATARASLTAYQMGPWSVTAGYYYRFMGGSANGADLRVTYSW